MKTTLLAIALVVLAVEVRAESWPQLQGDALRSGNAPRASLSLPLGLQGAVPLTDGIYAAPAIAEGRLFVVDGAGVVAAMDAQSLEVLWKFATRGGVGNCNNVAAPAVCGKYLHVGTMAGYYYVLDVATGEVVREIDCAEPIFAAPAVGEDRVYFATLGARVYALEPAGEIAWTWVILLVLFWLCFSFRGGSPQALPPQRVGSGCEPGRRLWSALSHRHSC